MTTETMNIHKALCELKVIDSRIEKQMNSMPMVIANEHANTKIAGVAVTDYKGLMESAYQSTVDLINRREAIKRAVVKSNAVTVVLVGGKEYTVAEAIEMKNHGLDNKRKLLNKLTDDYIRAKRAAESNNGDALERRADAFIRNLYNTTDMKNLAPEAVEERKNFIAAHTAELIDPLRISDKIAVLDKEIYEFSVDVDAVLSASNATTEIEISY